MKVETCFFAHTVSCSIEITSSVLQKSYRPIRMRQQLM